MFTKTVLALSAAIALATSSAAQAMPRHSAHGAAAGAAYAQSLSARQMPPAGMSSDAVIAPGGRVIGRDPDPRVRLQIWSDYLQRN